MKLARVVGTVVATEKHRAFLGKKILSVQPVDEDGVPLGPSSLAVDDSSSAGLGDLVLVLDEGTGARLVLGDPQAPIRSLIVGVVDQVTLTTLTA